MSAPLCDRHDDAMAPDADGGFACSIRNCVRRFSTGEGYYSSADPVAPHNRHACPSCGGAMHITRFTAHGPNWQCGRCGA